MSRLSIFPEHGPSTGPSTLAPLLQSSDAGRIQSELALRGIRFEQWTASEQLADDASQDDILGVYQKEVERVQSDGGYLTVDAIRMTPDHPDRDALRRKFLSEHTHAEDEVRFFVEGCGLFPSTSAICWSPAERVIWVGSSWNPPLVRHGTDSSLLRFASSTTQGREPSLVI